MAKVHVNTSISPEHFARLKRLSRGASALLEEKIDQESRHRASVKRAASLGKLAARRLAAREKLAAAAELRVWTIYRVRSAKFVRLIEESARRLTSGDLTRELELAERARNRALQAKRDSLLKDFAAIAQAVKAGVLAGQSPRVCVRACVRAHEVANHTPSAPRLGELPQIAEGVPPS